ncbi:MAG: 2-amino-4-hydroxy-6-hydroxymethyldihydropteridine diphosphokinase [Anaerolineae bacterium]
MTSNNTSSIAYLSLGSNIQPEHNLTAALQLLATKCTLLAVSHAYRTPPQGFTKQDDFLNLAVKISTDVQPITLKTQVLDWIECELKRVRDPNNKNAPRTIDLDISLWNDEVIEFGEKPWRVPDPDILRFAHVVVPLAEIAPEYLHPLERVLLKTIIERFSQTQFDRFRLPYAV